MYNLLYSDIGRECFFCLEYQTNIIVRICEQTSPTAIFNDFFSIGTENFIDQIEDQDLTM
jgi:hypothetical protein